MRFDLHTHPLEAISLGPVTRDVVAEIVHYAQQRGLDGIASTEHHNKEVGYEIKRLVEQFFPGQLLVIPGQEIEVDWHQEVELYLPDGRVFRFLAHPVGKHEFEGLERLQGIEVDNGLHSHIDAAHVKEVARQYGLMMLSNSDAHSLSAIGQLSTELSWDDLMARSVPLVAPKA
ncbi:MAG: PHP domain-containing protein [Chloroflexi bacterium]|nr:PHP domain-containing protein [Chloroflexota bacterium]